MTKKTRKAKIKWLRESIKFKIPWFLFQMPILVVHRSSLSWIDLTNHGVWCFCLFSWTFYNEAHKVKKVFWILLPKVPPNGAFSISLLLLLSDFFLEAEENTSFVEPLTTAVQIAARYADSNSKKIRPKLVGKNESWHREIKSRKQWESFYSFLREMREHPSPEAV